MCYSGLEEMQSLLFLGISFLLALAKSVDHGVLKNNIFHLSVGHVNTNAESYIM